MFEKCDLADALERALIKERKAELDKTTGFWKLWPQLRPKVILYIGLLLIFVGQVRPVSTGLFMGQFMAVLSTPLDYAIMSKVYPDSGEKTP